jgi:hypothetical protein
MLGLLSGYGSVLGQNLSRHNVMTKRMGFLRFGREKYWRPNISANKRYPQLNVSATKYISYKTNRQTNVSAAMDFKQFFTLKNSPGFFVK